eukprot:GHVT01041735.1.p1 GENE.GHVT01041735.1~~GHVT01041735.1.p1  ORF type:complete len:436 (+),score=103.02 GHVT01041735.1:342-1649(+)
MRRKSSWKPQVFPQTFLKNVVGHEFAGPTPGHDDVEGRQERCQRLLYRSGSLFSPNEDLGYLFFAGSSALSGSSPASSSVFFSASSSSSSSSSSSPSSSSCSSSASSSCPPPPLASHAVPYGSNSRRRDSYLRSVCGHLFSSSALDRLHLHPPSDATGTLPATQSPPANHTASISPPNAPYNYTCDAWGADNSRRSSINRTVIASIAQVQLTQSDAADKSSQTAWNAATTNTSITTAAATTNTTTSNAAAAAATTSNARNCQPCTTVWNTTGHLSSSSPISSSTSSTLPLSSSTSFSSSPPTSCSTLSTYFSSSPSTSSSSLSTSFSSSPVCAKSLFCSSRSLSSASWSLGGLSLPAPPPFVPSEVFAAVAASVSPAVSGAVAAPACSVASDITSVLPSWTEGVGCVGSGWFAGLSKGEACDARKQNHSLPNSQL